jgi:hypothetical protein
MMRRAYRFFLFLYPREHREHFAEEMAGVFDALCDEKHGRGWHIRFAFREFAGMIGGAAGAWLDRQSQQVMDIPISSSEPRDLAEAQQRVQSSVAAMIHAIATHQFERARRFSDEERAARCLLQALRAKYGITN